MQNQHEDLIACPKSTAPRHSPSAPSLQKLLDASLDVICSISGDGLFLTVSAAASKVWGYEPEELEGRPYIDLVVEEDREATRRIEGAIRAGTGTTNFENRYTCKDGTIKPILWSSHWDSEGQVFYAVARDASEKKDSEVERRLRERRMRRAYTLAGIAWWELDLATQTYTSSDEIFELYGLPVPPNNQSSVEEFLSYVHPDDVSLLQQDLTGLGCETYFNYEHRIIKPSGEVAYLVHYSELIRDESGKPVALHGSTKDITKSKLHQLKLEASESKLQKYSQRLSVILEGLGDGFFAVSRSWIITYWNRKAEQISKKMKEEVLGKNLWEVYPGAVSLKYYEACHQAMNDNLAVHFEEYSPTYEIWLEVSAYPTDEGLAVCIRDITEHKRYEQERKRWGEQLRQAHENLQNIMESMSDGFYTLSRDWTITFATDKVAAMVGLKKEEYLGRNFWKSFPEGVGTKFYSEYHRAFEQHRLVSFEEYYAPFKMWFEVNAYPKGDELCVFVKDISERKRQEQELQVSNERFLFVSQATSDVVWDWNLETDDLYINQSFTHVFGYEFKKDRHLRPLWFNHLHPEDKGRVTASQTEALNNRETLLWKERYRFIKANGEIAYVSDRAVIVRNEQGTAIRMIGAVKDITKEKKQEWRLEFMAKATSEVIWERGIGAEEVEVTTDKFNRLFGYSLQGGRSRHSYWLERVHPEDLPRVRENQQRAFSREVDFFVDEYRFRKADGTWAVVRERTYLIKNDEGNAVSLLGAIEDITPQRMAEKALVESERNYRQLFDHAPLPTLISDAETLRYLDVNSAAIEHFGYSKEEFLAMTVLDIRPPEEHSWVLDQIRQIREGIKRPAECHTFLKKEGGAILAEVSASLIEYQGRKALLATIKDVTDKIRLQKQLVQEQVNHQKRITQAAIEAQERERSEIGKELHDGVNQMLTTVKLYVENIKYYPEQSAVFIDKGTVLVQNSINEIRRLSRALVTPTIRDVGFRETLQELVGSYQELHLFEVDCFFNFEESQIDKGVKLTLYRILQEAFNNTVKYARASLVQIIIQGGKNVLRLDYQDNGVGFNLGTVKRGLGLSNIQNRADAYRGHMRIKSSPGQGCHIRIIFPLKGHL